MANEELGRTLYATAETLYPLFRSITGEGVRETLRRLQSIAPIDIKEVPSGAQVLDWTVPKEWNVTEAYIAGPDGRRVADIASHTLHLLHYSTPVRTRLPLAELKSKIFTLPDQPDLIPYRTSYYAERWGFCMSHNAVEALPEGEYEVVIDATLSEGSLTYGECVIPGATQDEILLSAHICHPSLANDNCSGLAVLAHLAAALSARDLRHTVRCLFAPGTIGAITWLGQNEADAGRIKHGLVISGVGDAGGPTYKRSRRGDAPIDRAMTHVLEHAAPQARILDFSPYGYDERQYNSPGFALDVGLFQRSEFGTFPEYHTSADNLDFIEPEYLAASFEMILAAIDVLERDRTLVNLQPKGEPQLGRRGLYAAIGGDKDAYAKNMAMLWTLNLCDGAHSLLDIARRSALPFSAIADIAETLESKDLLREVTPAV